MNEKKKHKIMLGIEVVLLCMIVAILGTNAASSNPPSNGVSYGKNNQTTVEGALNDLYGKASQGNATASQILKGKTALVGGNKVTGTMEDRGLAQYGKWGCGDAGCGSGNDVYYAINGLPEGYYHSDGNTWAPEARINANTLRTSLGITADKILKGKSIAGVSGTGETTCPSFSSMFEGKRFASGGTADIQVTKDKNHAANGYTDETPKTWNSWIGLASAGGTYNGNTGSDSNWTIESSWNIPIDNNFYQASKVVIKLLNYDGTQASLDKSGDTDFYTHVRYGSKMDGTGNDAKEVDNFLGIVPEITIYKNPNSWTVAKTKSNIDWYRSQNKLSFNDTSNVLSDKSMNWTAGFTANVKDNNTKLGLVYYNFKEEMNQTYTGAKKFTRNADGSSTATEDNWWSSSASDAYYYFGTSNTGKTAYYYKKDGTYKYTLATGNLLLGARYNHWSVVIDYYK